MIEHKEAVQFRIVGGSIALIFPKKVRELFEMTEESVFILEVEKDDESNELKIILTEKVDDLLK